MSLPFEIIKSDFQKTIEEDKKAKKRKALKNAVGFRRTSIRFIVCVFKKKYKVMNEEFDTLNKHPVALHGWFDSWCPSNGIADRLNNQAKGVWAQKDEWDAKMNNLKNGRQAAEWESLKKRGKTIRRRTESRTNQAESRTRDC